MYELRILRKYHKDKPNDHIDILQYRTREVRDYDEQHGRLIYTGWTSWYDVPIVEEASDF